MVGVVVAPVGVCHDDIGTVPFEDRNEAPHRFAERDVAEHVGAVLKVPVVHSRVVIPERLEMADPEVLASDGELGEAGLGHLVRVVSFLAWFDAPGPVPILTVGAGHQHRPDCLVRVASQDPAGARGLIIGMGEYCHQCQLFGPCHTSSLSRWSARAQRRTAHLRP